MADHIYIQARDEIISRLAAGVSAVSSRVYKQDDQVTDASRCPYLMVEVDAGAAPEDGSLNGSNGTVPAILQDEFIAVNVHCVVQQLQDGDGEKAAFALAAAAETALLATNAAKTLGGIAVNVRRPTVNTSRDTGGALETYAVSLGFQVWLRHLESRPDSFTY